MPEVEQVDRYDASLFRLSFIFPPISRACGFPLETIRKDPRKKATKEVPTGDERGRKGEISIPLIVVSDPMRRVDFACPRDDIDLESSRGVDYRRR
jgi:hypothetical protein